MSEVKININTQGGPFITGGEFHGTEFVANKYVYTNERATKPKFDDIEDAVEVTDEEQDNSLDNSSTQEIPESVKECFRFSSDFVKQYVEAIVKDFYLGQNVNLAMIEVVLYDHGQLKKRNGHTAFVRALKDWGILSTNVDIAKAANGMATKFKSFPPEGYKEWKEDHLNDRTTCISIGKKLSESMKYIRNE